MDISSNQSTYLREQLTQNVNCKLQTDCQDILFFKCIIYTPFDMNTADWIDRVFWIAITSDGCPIKNMASSNQKSRRIWMVNLNSNIAFNMNEFQEDVFVNNHLRAKDATW